ncbi:MAG: serine/threonine-protein kinase [Gemmatimonadales bacterium]
MIESELGRGGMATVYRAHDLRHDRQVAMKVLHPDLAATLGPERFLREIRVTSRLQHPHILPVFDSGEAAGQLWYTMPYIEGPSLRERLRREVQLPVAAALDLATQVADALGYAHGQGIVHRDIKPENILIDGTRAVVADFGIARALDLAGGERLTETGLALGTPTYMSPEQAMGSPVDARSDIYSLACVLYEMLAGEPPFTGPTAQSIIAKRLSSPVPPLRTVRETVPVAVERAVEVALAKVPADRFATTQEFVAALNRTGLSAAEPSAAVHGVPRRRVALAAGIAVAVLALAAVLHWWPRPTARPDTSLVAVVPFRIAGSDSSLAYLHEGMVDLFAARLNGEAGPRSVDSRAVMRLWNASAEGRSDLPEGEELELARRLGAGRLLVGNIVGTAERLVLSASVIVEDAQRAVEIARRRADREPEFRRIAGLIRGRGHDLALNRGRPLEALSLKPLGSFHQRGEVRALIDDALYWGGDTTAASDAAQKTAQVVAGPPPPDADSSLHAYYYDVCARHSPPSRGSGPRPGSPRSSFQKSTSVAPTSSMPGTPPRRACRTHGRDLPAWTHCRCEIRWGSCHRRSRRRTSW